MMGNPGAGKSTLLSSLVDGTTIFESGITSGSGKTTEIKQVVYNGDTYIDTPGLSDVNIRDKAAAEIEKALKMSTKSKVPLKCAVIIALLILLRCSLW